MNIQLNNKRALVTGGNSGIGKAISLALANAGAKVAINYITHPEATDEMIKQIEATKGEAIGVKADISDAAAVSSMFDQIKQKWNGIDILVNNAGIDGERQMSWEADLQNWKKVIDINLFGTFYCSREALKYMIPQKSGVVLSISSVHELIAWSGYSAYTTSKAGVGMMTQTLAQEAAPYGVRVLSVGPGAIKTPINKSVWENPKTLQDLLEKIPLNRLGTTEEIAQMVVILVSDAASYVTGRTIFIDGGMTEYPDFSHGG
jgi:NAD(P)-dependent dehydrogenase (short-subunit alcohol dehydrogenase family)